MKKTLSILLTLLLIAALFVGCGSQSKPAESQTPATAQPPATTEAPSTEPEGIFITVNGVNVTVGIPFASLEEALGPQTAPSETIDSCDLNSDWKQTMHYYDGAIVTEDKDGNIDGVQISGGDSALMGKIRVGATKDDVIAVLGTPDTDESWGIYYENTKPMVNCYLDESTGLIDGFALMSLD